MVYRFKYIIPKLKNIIIPSIEELKFFSSRFSKKQWELLTNNKIFNSLLMEDLCLAELESDKILNK